MSTIPLTYGMCPLCGGEGPVAARCPQTTCTRQGMHYIPAAEELQQRQDEALRDPLIGAMLDDTYLVVRKLGHGGTGMVYLAVDPEIGLRVAIKVLSLHTMPRGLADLSRRKFRDEAAALALLTHPNVIRLHRYGYFRGAPFLAMEHVEGGRSLADDMDARLAKGDYFSLAETRALILQLLGGLEAAHNARVIHRDIKPENLMMQPVAGHEDVLRIVDFGIAKHLDSDVHTVLASGTPAYMAPEQMRNDPSAPWTDLYAAGVVAFELLTGVLPFAGRQAHKIYKIKSDPGFDPLSAAAHVKFPPRLASFLRQAMAHDVSRRFRTVAAMRKAFVEAMDAASQPAPPPPNPSPRAQDLAMPASDQQFEVAKRSWLNGELARLQGERNRIDERQARISGRTDRADDSNNET